MAPKNNPRARENELVIQSLKDELLIYDLKIHKACCLNETSALVWNLCDGNNSVSDISRELSRKLKSPITEDFVWLALNELKKDALLDDYQEINIKFDGLSRREIIRKVGFASMVALPVISSLVAPTAAMAQSAGSAPAVITCPSFTFLCGVNCCDFSLRCVDGLCCPQEQFCGGVCCPTQCQSGLCCPAGRTPCGGICCATGQCVNGTCCFNEVCAGVCCPGGTSCSGGVCCPRFSTTPCP